MKLPIVAGLVCLCVVFGLGVYVTDFPVYMGSQPATCNNCHVMDAVYEGWFHAGHHLAATCVDCHAPHALIPKYYIKAKLGMRDVWHFSLGLIPDPLRATHETDEMIQKNCIRCHETTVSEIGDGQMDSGRYCFDCHRSVAHGARGLTILPHQDTGLYPESQLLEE